MAPIAEVEEIELSTGEEKALRRAERHRARQVGIIGSVSATIGGVPALFTLRGDLIWDVERSPGLSDRDLDWVLARLIALSGGPDPIRRAARLIGGIPYVP